MDTICCAELFLRERLKCGPSDIESQAMAAEYFSKQICKDATVANGAERHEKNGTAKVLGTMQDD